MTTEPSRLDTLRCADQDREVVAQVLNNAYADGRLTFEEHADRISAAYDAKTFGDLNTLTRDLVATAFTAPVVTMDSPAPQPAETPALPTAGTFSGGNAILSTLKTGRIGTVASEVTVNAWLGEARLDFADATFTSRETIVNISGCMCDIKIRVPKGVDVNTHRVNVILGETSVKGVLPHAEGMRINLTGTLIMGEVKVMGPDVANQRRYARFAQ